MPDEFRPRPGKRYGGVKSGAVVKRGKTVTITVPKSERPHVRLAYVPAQRRSNLYAATLEGCSHRRTGYPGGFKVAGPRCSKLRIRVHGRKRPLIRYVSFGAGSCAADPSVRSIVVTADRMRRTPAPSCEPRRVGERLRDLGEALATVDAGALSEYWSGSFRNDDDGFRRFAINVERGGVHVRSYTEGLALLRKRGGLRLRITEVRIGRGGDGRFHALYWPRESRKSRTPLRGKLHLSCRRPTVLVLAAATARGGARATLCPKPAQPTPPKTMIVCAGRR